MFNMFNTLNDFNMNKRYDMGMVEIIMGKTYLTVTHVAKLLSKSGMTIRRYCMDGLFPGAFQGMDGGHWHIPEDSVREYCRERGIEYQG